MTSDSAEIIAGKSAEPHPAPVSSLTESDASICIVGMGPRGTSILERLLAHIAAQHDTQRNITIHVIDPYPCGAGRIWSYDQSAMLTANTVAADITVLPDSSVQLGGKVGPQLTVLDWIQHIGVKLPPGDPEGEESRVSQANSFPSRRLLHRYLTWVFEEVVRTAPSWVTVEIHQDRAIRIDDQPPPQVAAMTFGRGSHAKQPQFVTLEDGSVLTADAVVLAQGHLDAESVAPQHELAGFIATPAVGVASAPALSAHTMNPKILENVLWPTNAAEGPGSPGSGSGSGSGPIMVDAGYAMDLDLSVVPAGEAVIVRGLGLAFMDVLVLLTQERGGSFQRVSDPDGLGTRLEYSRSGEEPILYVGSRSGVPYHAKIGYPHARRVNPRLIFTLERINALRPAPEQLDLRQDLLPLIVAELAQAHYYELFTAHPERVAMKWVDFQASLERGAIDPASGAPLSMGELISRAIPDPTDRFNPFSLDMLDHPLTDKRFAGTAELSHWQRDRMRHDAARRSHDSYSQDSAVALALLDIADTTMALGAMGRLNSDTVAHQLDGWWHSLLASMTFGAPGFLLEELEALTRTGLVHFIGADMSVNYDPASQLFTALSTSQPEPITSRVLIDARLPTVTVSRCTDDLVRSLVARGAASELTIMERGALVGTGRLHTDSSFRLVRNDGDVHPARFAIGPWTSATSLSWLPRPRTNSAIIRQNDSLAQDMLAQL